ncbi:hypothetical protein KY290_036887 [Solanum tuberosum]|uniref:Uncharacterized protein n=1 Tax=Solanum tuberosum TaxID=4113 RepID=A0ABQ7TVN7_SOLTU|nr:hypothetical protein KY290_036887 [Solanum tuberosum]
MKMWPHTSGAMIEPPEPKVMPGRPPKCKRKAKNEPRKKYEKLSKRGVKMTCSKCHQVGHNKKACQTMLGWDNMEAIQAGNHAQVIHQCLSNHQTQKNHHCLANHQAQTSHQCLANNQAQVIHKYSVIKRHMQRHIGRGTYRGIGRGTGRGTSRSTCRAPAVALAEALEVYQVSSLINQGLWEIQHQQEDKRGPKFLVLQEKELSLWELTRMQLQQILILVISLEDSSGTVEKLS